MDTVNKILVGLIVLFAVLLGAVDKIFNGEGEVFQVYSTLLSGFSAAFIARITPHVGAALKGNGTPDQAAPPAPLTIPQLDVQMPPPAPTSKTSTPPSIKP
jgi:hypothetical protein